MVNVVIIVTMVHDDLVEAALQGKPCSIDLVVGILIVCLTNCFHQLFFVFGSIIETLYGSKKAQIQ